MNAVNPIPTPNRQFMSGNEAVACGAWEAGCRVACAYPGTPSTEILEYASRYQDMYSEWSVNEKVSLEVAIGASLAGSRALCAMKHVGLNVASDALMSQTLVGARGGLDKGRGESDANKKIICVIGDSTFLHMGMQGLLDITDNRGNVTILLLDNRTVGMTGGQNNPGSGRDIHGDDAPRVDFPKLVEINEQAFEAGRKAQAAAG